MRVVATAGHVDHGKSTLVLALTGTDPDRLTEEKARGLTIDLGFASTTLPSGAGISFVDVPGHVRFLKNMLAGVGAVDAALFVVAATEGWKPQSEEHLRILDVLGVRAAVVALTKVGGLDADSVALARLDVEERIEASGLAGAEVVEVDAIAGTGIDELRAALDRLVERVPAAVDRGWTRLWVDRSFAAAGAGTVVTGTLAGGPLAVGEEVEVQPGGRRVRVRALQVHGAAVTSVAPGNRVAVNLAGTERSAVARGDAVVHPDRWHLTDRVDAELEVLAALDHPVSRRGAYLAYLGSGEHPVRLRVLGPDRIEPGARGLVRLHLPVGLPLLPGDRYVLREAGRAETVGGGEVLDVAPVLPAARAQPDRSVARVVAERGWVEADVVERLTGERVRPVVGRWVVDPDVLAAAERSLRDRIDDAGSVGVDVATLDERARAVLARLDGVDVSQGRARAGAADDTDQHPYLEALRASLFAPPAPEEAGASRGDVHDLVRRGLVVERDGTFFAAEAVTEAARTLARLLAAQPDGVTVGEVRDALGCTRKHAVPLLGALDAAGVTRRRGDRRIAGPRLPAS